MRHKGIEGNKKERERRGRDLEREEMGKGTWGYGERWRVEEIQDFL